MKNNNKKTLHRWLALILTIVMMLGVTACGSEDNDDSKDMGLETEKAVTIWYTDSKYMDYLKVVAEQLQKANNKLTINIEYIEDSNYLTKIYDSSMREDAGPDIFIAPASELEKMCSMGIVAENNVYASNYTTDNYCDNAIKAATFNNKLYGYPIDFNVAFMAYHSTYAYYISSFKQLDEYIAHFESTEDNEAIQQIVSWDVSDMFLNYAFAAESISIGGDNGDDSTAVDVNDANLVKVMNEFIKFRDDYGIVKSQASKLECNKMFCNGNMSYTIMDMQYFNNVVESSIPFDICEIPALSDELKTKSLSETTLALVSPYAKDLEVAKTVANALSFEYASRFNENAGGISARKLTYEGERAQQYQKIYDIYTNSVIRAQFRGAATMYAHYEILVNEVYDGEDIVMSVADFAAYIKPREVQTQEQSSSAATQ